MELSDSQDGQDNDKDRQDNGNGDWLIVSASILSICAVILPILFSVSFVSR